MLPVSKRVTHAGNSSLAAGWRERVTMAALLAIIFVGCGSSAGSKTNVENAIARAAVATSLYSFSYYRGERTLFVQLPAYDPGVTCASFTVSGGKQYSDVWYLGLYVDWNAPVSKVDLGGTFPPSSSTGSGAYLNVVHADTTSSWAVNASGGTVLLSAAPQSEADQLAGVQVRGRVTFTLPKQPKALKSCSGGSSVADGGDTQLNETCTCVDEAGNTSVCTPGLNQNCCTNGAGNVEAFTLDVTANPCGVFCTTTAGDANNCAELNAGS
jgi:hypothetical protein